MPDTPAPSVAAATPAPPPKPASSGTLLATLVLITLPGAALIFFMGQLEAHSIVGLSILAIFGIMILFGALALIATVFERLSLSCSTAPLALPPGSIRATIALSLIVLFALISVMLYRSLNQPYIVEHLSLDQKTALLQEPKNQVMGVVPEACPTPGCKAEEMRYTVHLRLAPDPQSADLAKQLLILIGTLMTSVTSFYFASRNNDATSKALTDALGAATRGNSPTGDGATKPPVDGKPPDSTPAATPALSAANPDDEDGCDATIANPTADVNLPPARGGVAPMTISANNPGGAAP